MAVFFTVELTFRQPGVKELALIRRPHPCSNATVCRKLFIIIIINCTAVSKTTAKHDLTLAIFIT